MRSRFGQKTKKRYDFWPFSDDDRSPLPTFVLVASPSSSNTRTRRRRATTFAPPEARGRNDQATYRCIASVRRTRYGETRVVWRFAKQREKDDDDDRNDDGERKTVLSLSLYIKPDQKPPLKRREKREKQRTYRCEQRGGGGRGDGRLGELLRQVGRLDRLVDRTVSKGEERAIGERAAKRFIRGESHSSSPHHHHHGPKNKRTKY